MKPVVKEIGHFEIKLSDRPSGTVGRALDKGRNKLDSSQSHMGGGGYHKKNKKSDFTGEGFYQKLIQNQSPRAPEKPTHQKTRS